MVILTIELLSFWPQLCHSDYRTVIILTPTLSFCLQHCCHFYPNMVILSTTLLSFLPQHGHSVCSTVVILTPHIVILSTALLSFWPPHRHSVYSTVVILTPTWSFCLHHCCHFDLNMVILSTWLSSSSLLTGLILLFWLQTYSHICLFAAGLVSTDLPGADSCHTMEYLCKGGSRYRSFLM